MILLFNCNEIYDIGYLEYPNLFYLPYIQILSFHVLLIAFAIVLPPNSSMWLAHHIDVLECFSLFSIFFLDTITTNTFFTNTLLGSDNKLELFLGITFLKIFGFLWSIIVSIFIHFYLVQQDDGSLLLISVLYFDPTSTPSCCKH